jgi:hypothetical protein
MRRTWNDHASVCRAALQRVFGIDYLGSNKRKIADARVCMMHVLQK